MTRKGVVALSLIDIMKVYFNYSDSDFEKQGKNAYLTRCPIHKEKKGTSLSVYDKTGQGKGWDWFCFGSCHTGGSAPKLLVEAGLFDTVDAAVKDIRDKFNLTYPDHVDLENFSDFKGFDVDFLKSRGIDDHEHVHDGNIIKGVGIPYYDTEGKLIAVKKRLKYEGSGKYMFTEGKNTIYGLDLLPTYSQSYLYVCEGETDTLTLLQAGLQAVGIPGAAAWKDDWKPLFENFEKIIVLADNDKAGKELRLCLGRNFPSSAYTAKFPRQFNDVNDYFLYGCAGNKEVLQEYFTTQTPVPATPETFIAEIKDNINILANSAAWQNVLDVIGSSSTEHELFLERVKKETGAGARLLNKAYKEAVRGVRTEQVIEEDDESDIFIRNNAYYKRVSHEFGIMEEKISNFRIVLLHTIETDGDHVRICKLVNEQGKVSRLVRFDSDTLTKQIEFMSECKRAGNYIFKGNFQDLIAINEILLAEEVDVVHSPDHIGRVGKVWLMGKYGIDSKGTIVESDEHGILNLDDNKYAVRNLNVIDENDDTYMPSRPDEMEITDTYLKEVAHTIKANIGGYEAWMALGFTVAGWHSDEIYRHKNDKAYPIFFIGGKRNSGKTYLARWLMSAYGFQNIEGKNFAMPSVVSMTRKLGYYSSLPQWYDDYRNEIKDIKYRNEFMLGAFNRQGADKGTKAQFGVRSEAIRGFLLLSGEDTPDDNAVLSRCYTVQVSAHDRDDTQLVRMLDLVRQFPSLGLHFLKRKQGEGSDKLLAQIDELQSLLMSNGIDGRLAKNAAVFAGSFLHGFGHTLTAQERVEFLEWLCTNAATIKANTDNDHTVARFFSDMTVLMANGKLVDGHHYRISKSRIYLWFKACYDVWSNEYDSDIKRTVLLDYIVKEPFFKKKDWPFRLSQEASNVRTLVIDYTKVPDEDFKAYCEQYDDENCEF